MSISIAWPDEKLVKLLKLKSEGGYEPNIIILSNLELGLKDVEYWNWDLSDTKVDGKTLLEHVIEYVSNNVVIPEP